MKVLDRRRHYGSRQRKELVTYATRGMIEALLALAEDAEPDPITAALAVTPAQELREPVPLPNETPIFTHFYMPEAGKSVRAVFGMDLTIPHGQTQGRFISHPLGKLALTRKDHLHETVFVAVPPWDTDSLAAFNRAGTRQPMEIIDAEPPEESIA